jgi:hypothetical protein
MHDCIGQAVKEDRHLSTRKIAKVLNISFTTVRHHFTKPLMMKCDYMRWDPHMLTAAQKTKCKEMTGSMLRTLESHAVSNIPFLCTGDELWMFCECRR